MQKLTNLQMDVLKHIRKGISNAKTSREIANLVFISDRHTQEIVYQLRILGYPIVTIQGLGYFLPDEKIKKI